MSDDLDFSKDILRGADAIAEYLFGDRRLRRKVYHLASTSKFPHFKLGSKLCARKSTVTEWIENQERWRERKKDDQANSAEKYGLGFRR
jgi:hypothetical protein